MQLDFTNLFNGSNETLTVNHTVNLADLEYSTYKPIKNGAIVKGKAYCKADVVYLELQIDFDFNGVCDRCAEDVVKNYSLSLNKIVVPQLANDDVDYDEYIVAQNNIVDVDALVEEEIQLFLPQKMLCSEDCLGLCFKCGKNLNKEKCDCKKDVDPRMAVLLQLLDEE